MGQWGKRLQASGKADGCGTAIPRRGPSRVDMDTTRIKMPIKNRSGRGTPFEPNLTTADDFVKSNRPAMSSTLLRGYCKESGHLLLDFLTSTLWTLLACFVVFRNRKSTCELFLAIKASIVVDGHGS